ncbi:L-type lectin-domain containing receptor kinase IV.1-like [Phalaenopsis equestris]|uniref:L-type lectin-domain containing receptor kinase IV.1-like n=1 Tax=Phalaenopsis equestris TaxID=78828 RepID=UPI0009E4A540|nr:L-type lectin-domain containing receptor kinase IV.1-like [Phalaenopsis equestris]
MLHTFAFFFFLFTLKQKISPVAADFLFNAFHTAELILNGAAAVQSTGILRLTNNTNQEFSHAFYPTPFSFLNTSSGEPSSFSTSFVFVIIPRYIEISSEGLAFVISPTPTLADTLPSQFLGLFNLTSDGQATNHIVAVELDTVQNKEFDDVNDNHVGIDLNGLTSVVAAPAAYANGSSSFQNLSLFSGQPMRVWAEYDAKKMEFNVTLAPLNTPKPALPLLSSIINLSSVFLSEMYVGFSSSTGTTAGSHYILGWSFCLNCRERELVPSDLPSLLPLSQTKKRNRTIAYWLPVAVVVFLIIILSVPFLVFRRRRQLAESAEDWEMEYGPKRFSYGDLHRATRGFSDENFLGSGGFGEVYRGVLAKSKQAIAVKRISHDSKQGMKEFIAEISSIGRLRHRNLVQLIGYTRRRGKLMLVYDFMPNGSLDNYLFNRVDQSLTWKQRFHIIKGIAAGLLYLHEGWEQVVLHRDIKASNVLLDAGFNGKLGDFGLARLHDRGSMAETTRVFGTLGYLAPEISRTGKSTTSSDVFAFGAFLLEVACGKKPVEFKTSGVDLVLVDWVLELMERGELIEARDRRLGNEFVVEEMEIVLRLGLLCSSPVAEVRPSMRQVVQCLEGQVSVPALTEEHLFMFHSGSIKKRLVGDVSLSGSGGRALAAMGSSGQDQCAGLPLSFGR